MAVAFVRLMCVLFALLGTASAEEVHFPVSVSDASVAPGGTVPVRITVAVPPGLHTYRDTITVTTVNSGTWKVGEPSLPPGVMRPDPGNNNQPREEYEDDVLIDVPVTAPVDAKGEQAIAFHTRVQGCKKDLCFFPEETDITAMVKVLVGAVVPPAAAAPPASAEPTVVTLTAVASGPDTARFHAHILDGWHVNKAMVSADFTTPPAEGAKPTYALGAPCLPDGKKSGSEADGTAREDLETDFDFVVPVTGPAGDATLDLTVQTQACQGAIKCQMPMPTDMKVPVKLTGGTAFPACPTFPPAVLVEKAAAVTPAPVATPVASNAAFAAAQQQGAWALILFCFLGGIGVSFTPCVLPMVPITMGIIGARGAGSRAVAFSLATTYVAGLALVYTGLGVFAGMTNTMFGSWLQSTWLVGGIAAFFFVMGASMFGFFDVGVPSFIASRLSGKGGGGGYGGAFVVGMIGAIVAGPCSGPVVASILGYIAQASHGSDTGALLFGAALMFAFSIGMGLIFLVTAAANGWLPQRGAWMVVVKKSFGIVMWLGAVYYLSPQLSTATTALLTAGVLLSTAVFAWPSPEDGEGVFLERLRQLYTVSAGLVGAYLLVGTLVHEGFILPPMQVASASAATAGPSAADIQWVRSETDGLAQAAKEGKPVMVDFTAEWCALCHEMEKTTYRDPRVVAASKDFVMVMVDVTKTDDPAIAAILRKYDVVGPPKVVFLKPDGTHMDATQGYVAADDFLPHMQAAVTAAKG